VQLAAIYQLAHVAGRAPGGTRSPESIVDFGEFSSLLTVKTLTGMTTDVYPRENCIAPLVNLALY
jgi:hypothetical protein